MKTLLQVVAGHLPPTVAARVRVAAANPLLDGVQIEEVVAPLAQLSEGQVREVRVALADFTEPSLPQVLQDELVVLQRDPSPAALIAVVRDLLAAIAAA
ncbi:hypothetical protein GFY24_31115 [Nocardia sp. SYP-A9097]|uniref:hypothetical protein n=1 Tax=Nocardia sp. SYP-A9097 TaxID=2663237 RepID=UPI00129A6B30|nr:hypothetical protein [Nocardia sp. SYP-A9097]MRH91836.1 hypothetical protein [Nocardia sp. SYP-A9097]